MPASCQHHRAPGRGGRGGGDGRQPEEAGRKAGGRVQGAECAARSPPGQRKAPNPILQAQRRRKQQRAAANRDRGHRPSPKRPRATTAPSSTVSATANRSGKRGRNRQRTGWQTRKKVRNGNRNRQRPTTHWNVHGTQHVNGGQAGSRGAGRRNPRPRNRRGHPSGRGSRRLRGGADPGHGSEAATMPRTPAPTTNRQRGPTARPGGGPGKPPHRGGTSRK